jgi:diguanylate cyclase (GGDEF)-like protein
VPFRRRRLRICDLDGFKAYNDTFGHPAGDALLTPLGAALTRELGQRGRAYRIDRDEFCVLARPDHDNIDEIVQLADRAHTEHGEGFSITASHGAILLPADASTATEAMRALDLRMYENKNSSRVSADMQTINALLRAVHERDPGWAQRLITTADLAGAVCQQLGVYRRSRWPASGSS